MCLVVTTGGDRSHQPVQVPQGAARAGGGRGEGRHGREHTARNYFQFERKFRHIASRLIDLMDAGRIFSSFDIG